MKKIISIIILLFGAFITAFSQNVEWKLLYENKETHYCLEKSKSQTLFCLKIKDGKYEVSNDNKLHLHLSEGSYIQIPCYSITKENNDIIVKYLITKDTKQLISKDKIDALLIFPIKGSLINIIFDDNMITEINELL